MTQPATLVELLEHQAARQPDAVAFVRWADDLAHAQPYTYQSLSRDAARVAGLVAETTRPGDRVVLVVLDQLSFVAAFLGAQLAGRIPVPASPPTGSSGLHRLSLLIADCEAALVLFDPLFAGLVGQLPEIAPLAHLGQSIAAGLAHEPLATRPSVRADDVAFLQYTSGSTRTPKGVLVTHANVLANERLIEEAFGHGPETVIASWLPSFHDMGLIGGLLQPLYLGIVGHLMTPNQFLNRPLDWLRLIEASGATTSGAPNFGYELCLRRTTEQERVALDLRRWRVAFNGAEPVSADTLRRFADAFAVAGFRESALYPCYGLAEATLFVTGAQAGQGPVVRSFDRRQLEAGRAVPAADGPATPLVSSGRDRHRLVSIIDPEGTATLDEGAVGEIMVRGASVTTGYWQNEHATAQLFRSRPEGWSVRTGDLGVLLDGELFVTGRVRDLIIVRGRNIHPHDVEAAVVAGGFPVRGGSVVAVGHQGPGGETGVLVLAETAVAGPYAWLRDLRERVARDCDVQVDTVVLCAPGSLPRTTSGKKQRSLARQQWLAGDLQVLHEDARLDQYAADAQPVADDGLRGLVARVVGLAVQDLPGDVPLVALGLDSIGAAGVALSAREELGLDLSARDLIEAAGLDALLGTVRLAVGPADGEPVGGGGRPYPATPAQEIFLGLAERFPDDPSHTLTRLLEVVPEDGGRADPELVCTAAGELIRRHPVLRTRFAFEGRRHVVVDAVPPPLRPHRFAAASEVHAWAAAAAAAPVDLTVGPGARLDVAVTADGRVFLLAVSHHATTDFWSLARLLTELRQLLAGAPAGHLPSVGEGVARHALARSALQNSDVAREWARQWRDRLDGARLLPLPAGPGGQAGYACAPVRLPAAVREQVRTWAAGKGITPSVLLLACFQRILAGYTGTDDVTIAVPFHGRTDPAWRYDLGCFVNALPVRIQCATDASLNELVGRVGEALVDAEGRQDLPLGALGVRLPRSSRCRCTPATQVGFVVQSFADPAERAVAPVAVPAGGGAVPAPDGGHGLVLHPVPRAGLDGELVLTIVDVGEELHGALEYDPAAVDAGWANALAAGFASIVGRILATAETDAGIGHVLGGDGAEAVLDGPQSAVTETVVATMLRLAAEDPERAAVECGGRRLNRRELVAAARRNAGALRVHGVRPGDVVGVHLPATESRVPWVLAVWLAGAVYLPLDLAQPAERLVESVVTAGCRLIVSHDTDAWHARAEVLVPGTQDVVDDGTPDHAVRLDEAAYVLFTSGTSGRPKGTLLEHRGLANVARSQAAWFRLGPDDRVLAFSAHSFDAAVFELVLAVTAGATFVVPTPPEREVDELGRTMRRRGITATVLTPSVIAQVPDSVELPQLRTLMLAGEELPVQLAERWASRTALFNLYGPTECTIWSTAARIRPGDPVTIGVPIGNTRLEVVDDRGRRLPTYAVGELVVCGAGVGRGYLGDVGAAAAGAFETRPDSRRYRTGDRVRLRGDGRVEYRGRADGQVKIHGVRVEIREIEHRLRDLPGVADAHCLVVDRTTPQILAFVRPRPGAATDAAALRRGLLRHLPPAMVPARFMLLGAIPVDRHGKVDRRALLAAADRAPAPVGGGPVEPISSTQARVAAVVAEVLGHAVSDVGADLLDLGMGSIEAARLAGRLGQVFSRSVRVASIYEHPTVSLLARHLEQLPAAENVAPAPRTVDGGAVPLTGSQSEILLAHRLGQEGTAYHMPLLMSVRGQLDPMALAEAVRRVVAAHPALRSRLRAGAGASADLKVVLSPSGESGAAFDYEDLRTEIEPELRGRELARAHAARPFDLEGEAPLRLLLLRIGEEHWMLSMVAHHGFVDGWSLGVVMEDVSAAYRAVTAGRDWSAPVEELPAVVPGRADDWSELDWPRAGPLPLDGGREGPRASVVVERTLPASVVRDLPLAARHAGVSPFVLALAAWYMVLAHRSGREHLVGATVLGGRDAAAHRTVGCLAATVPLPVRLRRSWSWEELAQELAWLLRRAAQGAPGVAAIAEAAGLGSVSRCGLMQTLFVQGDPRFWSLELAGCTVHRMESAPPLPKSDLAVTFTSSDGGCQVALEYDRSLFREPEVTVLLDQFEASLGAAVADPAAGISRSVDRPSPAGPWTPPAGTLWDRFQDLCRRTGSTPAVVDETGRTWSRDELAGVVAAVVANPRAAHAVRGGVASVVSVLAAWSGGATVSLDGRTVGDDAGGGTAYDAAVRVDLPGGVQLLGHGDLLARLDWLTGCLAANRWVLPSAGDDLLLGLLWPVLSEGAVADLSQTPRLEADVTTVRLVPPVELAGRPLPATGRTVLVLTREVTAAWCAEAARAPGCSVLRLWAPGGVPVARWAGPGSHVLDPAPGVDLEVRGALGQPAALYGFGELVVRSSSGFRDPWATGVRGRRMPEGVEFRGLGSELLSGGRDLLHLEVALDRSGAAPLAFCVAVPDAAVGTRLCFVVPVDDVPDVDTLLHRVRGLLAPGAAPDRLVIVPRLPPDPEATARLLLASESAQALLPEVLQAWGQVLGEPPASPDVSFFDAGGTSARALTLQATLERALGRQVPVNAVFEFPTARQLARHLAGSGEPDVPVPVVMDRSRLVQLRARRGRAG